MTDLFVIADDLTGATDAAAQLSARGLDSEVWIWPTQFLEGLDNRWKSRAVVVNSESRHLPAAAAARVVADLARAAKAQAIPFIYKKTDSTLRGNIGAELTALRGSLGAPVMPFIPASPVLGRTTREGIHYVHGTPLAQTSYARDPRNPIQSSSVKEILGAQTNLYIRQANSTDDALNGEGIVVFDAESASDLSRIARTLIDAKAGCAAGPAAFLQSITEALQLAGEPRTISEFPRPILCFNGSLNPLALGQIAHPALDGIRKVYIPAEVLFGEQATLESWAREQGRGPSGSMIVSTFNPAHGRSACEHTGLENSVEAQNLHARAARAAGMVFRSLLAHEWASAIIIGGDTLSGIAHACGWSRFEALGELLPGVALVLEPGSGLTLATKPGGFGDIETIARLLATSQPLSSTNRAAKSSD